MLGVFPKTLTGCLLILIFVLNRITNNEDCNSW